MIEKVAGFFAGDTNDNQRASRHECRKMRSRRAGIGIASLAMLLWMAAAGHATVAFSPSSLSFLTQFGAGNPDSQTTQVVGGIDLPPGTWSITVATGSGGSWLSAAPTSGQGPASITVSVNVAGLQPGNYSGAITVSEVRGNSATASVSLQITSGITLTPSTLNFVGQVGGSNPSGQALLVNYPSGITTPPTWKVNVSTSSGGNWLSVSPQSGQGSGTLTVTVNISGLAAGSFSGNVTVIDAAGSTATAIITLQNILPPAIALTPTTLSFSGQSGGPNPAPQTTLVTNPGGGGAPGSWTVTVSTANGGNWLSASPSSSAGIGQVTVSVNIAGLAGGTYNGTVTVSQAGVGSAVANVTLQLSGSTTPPPTISSGGLVNGASFSKLPPAAASIASLFGLNFGTSVVFATTLPLPTQLGGVSVVIKSVTSAQSGVSAKSVLPVGGINAPLFSVSPSQINLEIPVELADQTQATATVVLNGIVSNTIIFNVAQYNPAIFAINQQGSGQGAILISNTGELVAPSGSVPGAAARPAKAGEYITIYCTGLGPVTNQPADGVAALSNPLSVTTTNPTVKIGGNPVPATQGFFSGLTPNFVGLYQVNAQVPANASPGDLVPVTLNIGGVDSNTVTIAVQ